VQGLVPSPIRGASGNVEFLAYLVPSRRIDPAVPTVGALIEDALTEIAAHDAGATLSNDEVAS
jgi:deoxyhypusine synthase